MASDLHRIQAPALNQSLGSNIEQTFNRIDDNFGVLANKDLVKGDAGDSLISYNIKLSELFGSDQWTWEDPSTLGEYHGDGCVAQIKQALATLKDTLIGVEEPTTSITDEDVVYAYNYLVKPENNFEALICFNKPETTSDLIVIKSVIPIIFIDMRFRDYNLTALNAQTYDLSCTITFNSDSQDNNWICNQTFPTLYYDYDPESVGQEGYDATTALYWVINGTRTRIPARGPKGINGKSGVVYLGTTDTPPTYWPTTSSQSPLNIVSIFDTNSGTLWSTPSVYKSSYGIDTLTGSPIIIIPDRSLYENPNYINYREEIENTYFISIIEETSTTTEAKVTWNNVIHAKLNEYTFKSVMTQRMLVNHVDDQYYPNYQDDPSHLAQLLFGYSIKDLPQEEDARDMKGYLIHADVRNNEKSFNIERVNDITADVKASGYNITNEEYLFKIGGAVKVQEGENNANGVHSHAEGLGTTAGDYAHSEGKGTTAGNYSHAEGENTKATGTHSHAEGKGTTAGNYSHAEGENTKATGTHSHAEGKGTGATGALGNFSHSEGENTTASGTHSHAEGNRTIASETGAHVEGGGDGDVTVRSGVAYSKADGLYSHAEGSNNYAHGECSHAEGYSTKSDGYNSHSEGAATLASGDSSHSEGSETTASGDYSHAEGSGTTASGDYSHAEGYGELIKSEYTVSPDNFTNLQYNTTTTPHKLSVGEYVCSSAVYNIANIRQVTEILGGYSFKLNANFDPQISNDSYIYIVKGISGGDYSHTEGGLNVASGKSSHAEGYNTLASNDFSHTEGQNTYAKGIASHSEGSAGYDVIIDDKLISGTYFYDADNTPVQIPQYAYKIRNPYNETPIYPAKNDIESVTGCVIESVDKIYSGSGQNKIYYIMITMSGDMGGETVWDSRQRQYVFKSGQTFYFINTSFNYDTNKTVNAVGPASHAEGINSYSSGVAAHAEGFGSRARGLFSHAEGYNTIADGRSSHAEGEKSRANAPYAHAEGYNNYASGSYSHAEGYDSYAEASCAHAEGHSNIASGENSHAEGFGSRASGPCSHAEGTSCNLNRSNKVNSNFEPHSKEEPPHTWLTYKTYACDCNVEGNTKWFPGANLNDSYDERYNILPDDDHTPNPRYPNSKYEGYYISHYCIRPWNNNGNQCIEIVMPRDNYEDANILSNDEITLSYLQAAYTDSNNNHIYYVDSPYWQPGVSGREPQYGTWRVIEHIKIKRIDTEQTSNDGWPLTILQTDAAWASVIKSTADASWDDNKNPIGAKFTYEDINPCAFQITSELTGAKGAYSHTEGYGCMASYNYTHAEGFHTNAINEYEHAQGILNETGFMAGSSGSYYVEENTNISHNENKNIIFSIGCGEVNNVGVYKCNALIVTLGGGVYVANGNRRSTQNSGQMYYTKLNPNNQTG